eukprot:295026_1
MKSHGVDYKYTTAYKPSTNGQIERLHRWIKERLSLLAHDLGLDFIGNKDEFGDNWTHYLPIIQYKYNNTSTRMTSYSPSNVVLGYDANDIIDVDFDPKAPEQYKRYMNARIKIIRDKAYVQQSKYDKIRKKYYDKKRKESNLKKGDRVMYDISQGMNKSEKSLTPNYAGPLLIKDIYNNNKTIVLQDIDDKSIEFTTDIKYCKLFHNNIESP